MPPSVGATVLLGVTLALLGCGSDGPSDAAVGFPCEVERILQAKCQRCHGDPLQNAAPFPLLTWEDTQVSRGSSRIYERIKIAVSSRFMPLMISGLDPPVEPLTTEERAALLDWLEEGAQAVPLADCE